jgi:hypothetical protein
MTTDLDRPGDGRVLDPVDRYSEVLFGLFMVLSFTGTMSVATDGREEVRTMLIAAIGCNTAWGFVDGVMYVLRTLFARTREATLARAVRAAARPEEAQRLIADGMGPLAEAFGPAELERARQWFVARPAAPAARASVTGRDLRAALGIFLLVFASTFPVVLPFIFIGDLHTAKRVSGAIAIVMLYICGHGWGRYAGATPWRAGLFMVAMGVMIEAVVIALGG